MMRNQVNQKTLTLRIWEIMFLMMVAQAIQANQEVLIQIKLLEGVSINRITDRHVSMIGSPHFVLL